MTLPPCPIAGHNNPHHFHDLTRPPSTNGGDLYAVNGTPHRACDFEGKEFSRCYSAHVPEPTPDPDELVRVPVGVTIPKGTKYWCDAVAPIYFRVQSHAIIVTRSDLDAILKPTPTPAEKLAEAITNETFDEAWTAAQVQAVLDAAGLTLAERGEK